MLAAEKTKLLAFSSTKHKSDVGYLELVNNLQINNTNIEFSHTAEHVGIVRSSDNSNLPHILDRISSHRRALFGVLPAGLAKRHNANPAASLRVQNVYALSVLLSGLASIPLSNSEITILEKHYKNMLRCLMKLPDKCPDPVIYFLAGSFPLIAHIHKKQLNLFGMITRLPGSILHNLASKILMSEPDNSKSWFIGIRHLCSSYNLPSPLHLLAQPPSKAAFKSLVKLKVVDSWQQTLRQEASSKDSLLFFNPSYMSISIPHPLWTSCSSNSFEVNKAIIQASFLSGRYKTDYLARHWNHSNPAGYCLLCPDKFIPGTLQHLLLECEAFDDKRQSLCKFWIQQSDDNPHLLQLLQDILQSPPRIIIQFLLDPSTLPQVISMSQAGSINIDFIFYLTRTFCYGIHRRRLQLTGRFKIL